MYPLYIFLCLLPSGFTSDFRFYDYYYIIAAYIILYHLCFIAPVSYSYLINTMCIPYLISLAIYLTASVCLCSQHDFQCMFMSQIYRYTCAIFACHLAFTIPLVGEFWLSWILMSRSQSLELVNSPGCWSGMRSWSMDPQQTVQSPILLGPMRVSRVFLL